MGHGRRTGGLQEDGGERDGAGLIVSVSLTMLIDWGSIREPLTYYLLPEIVILLVF